MPFVPNTPESFVERSDSKNPNSTCRGITSNGRACRRGISVAKQPSGLLPRRPKIPDPRDESLYCWQHKEQADYSAHSSPGPRATATPILEERTSLDTLTDRLGILELQEKAKRQYGGKQQGRTSNTGNATRPPASNGPRPKPKQRRLECCFCFSIPIEKVEDEPKIRPQPRPVQQHQRPASAPMPPRSSQSQQSRPPPSSARSSRNRINASVASPSKSSHRSRKSTASQTAQLKDLIPDTLDAATASALMAELSRPYVDSEEPGYIYMFWLTPTSEAASPPVAAARSLLAPPSSSPSGKARSRRPSDVVSRFADASSATGSKTILLKIGRAANVQRRMNQWQQQCGYDIEMLRYYPYVSTSGGSSSSSNTPRMTPHCKRVERLIHIELAGMGMRANKDNCEACGRDHREWFEADASRAGVRKIDDVVRRWIEWDEGVVP